jgi:dethiobiotin synthetase
MATGYYVTGTDTAAGKTFASVALLHAWRARGLRALGMKPVASGCELRNGRFVNEDALALQAASSEPAPGYELVNPFALPEATAPQIAAAHCGASVGIAPMLDAYGQLAARADVVVVEGVGGWLAPFADEFEQAELARRLQLPVILVVGIKLGCLNHARLSEQRIIDDGLRIAGWIGNQVDPQLDYLDEYTALVQRSMATACLGVLPHAGVSPPSRSAPHLRLPEG